MRESRMLACWVLVAIYVVPPHVFSMHTWRIRFFLENLSPKFGKRLGAEWNAPRQQFIKHAPERPNLATRIHVFRCEHGHYVAFAFEGKRVLLFSG